MTAPAFLWSVFGHSDDSRRETVATFFTRSDAESFAMHPDRDGFERRNLYCAAPSYDRRTCGYRVGAQRRAA